MFVGIAIEGIRRYRCEASKTTSLIDFLTKQKEMKCQPYYDLNRQYASVYASYEFLKEWLTFQFPNYFDGLLFVKSLWSWINRKDKKRLIFTMVGPTNSGKTSVMEALLYLAGPFGTIQNSKVSSDFLFEQCINQRTIMMDEGSN